MNTTPHLYEMGLRWLRQLIGPNANFQAGQWEAIELLVAQRGRVLVVQRTGWGKSMVYFVATRLLREQGSGPTILISPLLALMRNQLEAAARLGLNAATMNSTNRDEWELVAKGLLKNEIDLLFISPERLGNEQFQQHVWQHIRQNIGLMAVDEAHCISDWGHDFRPDYRRIIRLLDELPPATPILGTTATANDRVVEDVAEILGEGIQILRGPLTRESLWLYVVEPPLSQAERLVLLVKLLKRMAGSGIIYCATKYDCQRVAEWLQGHGYPVKAYYSGVENDTGEDRVALEQQLLNNQVKALVASVALGMGFDKPDLHFVIHYQHPGSIIGYYQQIGRAGRGVDEARIVLMHGTEDEEIQRYFMETAFPQKGHVEKAINALQKNGPSKPHALQKYVNVKKSTLEKMLLHLEIEGIVRREDGVYELTGATQRPDYERWGKVTAQRERELTQMQAYVGYKGCLMRFIAEALDDPTPVRDCGRCQYCQDVSIKSNPTPDEIEAARFFLNEQQFITFQPRKMYPTGGVGRGLKGKIANPNAVGLALCYSGDGGWGNEVREVRQSVNPQAVFSSAMQQAAVKILQRYWATLDETPTWVTAVPSLRHPTRASHFARELAQLLNLPFHENAIRKIEERLPQSEMHNSHMQAQNVLGAYAIVEKIPQNQPVLLIDDLVDSGWTLTIIGQLLREAGSGMVYPFVLARTHGD